MVPRGQASVHLPFSLLSSLSFADPSSSLLGPAADYTNWDTAKLSAYLREKGVALPEAPSQAQL